MLSKNSKQLLLYSAVVYLGFLLISKIFNIIDNRFFMFFPTFIFGILTCKESLFNKSITTIMKIPVVQVLLAVFPAIFVIFIVIGSRTTLLLSPGASFVIESSSGGAIESHMVVSMLTSVAHLMGMGYNNLEFIIDSVILLNIFVIMFCVLEYKFAMKFINNKFSDSWSFAFTYIATASYCVYLFHRPFLALWNSVTHFIGSPILHA